MHTHKQHCVSCHPRYGLFSYLQVYTTDDPLLKYRNLSVLTALNGEPGWVCLLCCNSDGMFLSPKPHAYIPICRRSYYPYSVATNLISYPIVLFSAIVLHWVTFNDHTGSHRSRQVSRNEESQGAPHRGPGSPSPLNAANISAVPPAHVPQTCQCGSSVPESQEDSQGTKEDTTDRCLPLYHHYGLLRRERSLEMYEPQVLPPCPSFSFLFTFQSIQSFCKIVTNAPVRRRIR